MTKKFNAMDSLWYKGEATSDISYGGETTNWSF